MIDIQKKSFNYQDIFALKCNGYNKGTFVDVGCSLPDYISNVSLLLDNGWSGVGFDLDERISEAWKDYLFMKVYNVDVIKSMDIVNSAISSIPCDIDYLNVDVDGYPCQFVVENLDFKTKRYRCMTIEHDEYRFGSSYKDAQRKVLLENGYEIVVKTAAEDWYVDPMLVDAEFYRTLKQLPSDYIMDLTNIDFLIKSLGF